MTGMAWPYVAGLSTDVLAGVNLELHRFANPENREQEKEKEKEEKQGRFRAHLKSQTRGNHTVPAKKVIDPQGSSLIWTARLAVGPFVPAGS